MKNVRLVTCLMICVLGFAGLSGCAGKRGDAPAKLDTTADLWAEMDNIKAQLRKVNADLEEISYQLKSQEVGADGTSLSQLAERVSRLESNMTQMASQLAVDLEAPAAAPVTAPQTAVQPVTAVPYQPYQPAPGQPQVQEPEVIIQDQPYGQPGVVPTTVTTAPGAAYQPVQPQSPEPSGAIAPPVVAAPRDPADALYTKALQAFNAKQYQSALASWSDFIKSYPQNALVPNSMFWRGEAYYQLNDFANAVLAYQDVIEKFPKSAKYPDALFKRGAAFLKLGNAKAAKLSLQEVIDKYPDSTYAKRAKAMLPK